MKNPRTTMNRTPIVIPMIAPVESVDLLLVFGGAVHRGLSLHLQSLLGTVPSGRISLHPFPAPTSNDLRSQSSSAKVGFDKTSHGLDTATISENSSGLQ